MKTWTWLSVAVVVLALAGAGCGKKATTPLRTPATPKSDASEVGGMPAAPAMPAPAVPAKPDAAAIKAVFPAPTSAQQADLDKINAALAAGEYPQAIAYLQSLSKTNLTTAQTQAVNTMLDQANAQLTAKMAAKAKDLTSTVPANGTLPAPPAVPALPRN